jgi:CcmD family protein
MVKKNILTLFSIGIISLTKAQTQAANNTDLMRSNGKIYVVMAVVITILLGLFVYLFSIEKKLKSLEQNP